MTTTTHRPELILTDDQIRDDRGRWLAERGTGIGASDIAAVLGISPWDSPFSYYWRRQLATDVEVNEAMEWGLRHERTIAEKFVEQHPEFVVQPGGLYRHPEHRWMLATPDGLITAVAGTDPVAVMQIKTTHSWEGWGAPGTGQIPTHYAAQVQQEMTVMGVRRAWLPVLAGGNSYREYVVDWDPADADTITAAGTDFMARLEAGTPPDVDGAVATTTALKQLHSTVVDDVVTIPLNLADQYWTRRQLAADAQAALAEAENRIRALLGDYKTAVAGGQRVAQRSVYDTTRIDTKRLKAELPDVYADYSTTSTVNKLMPCKESK
jgi:putative phage-type endonuclease